MPCHPLPQTVQLLLVLGLLFVFPACLHDGGLETGRPWAAFCLYALFFGGGSVARMLRHGGLAPRKVGAEQPRPAHNQRLRHAYSSLGLVHPLPRARSPTPPPRTLRPQPPRHPATALTPPALPQEDAQVRTWPDRLAFAAFATAVPLVHIAAVYRAVGRELAAPASGARGRRRAARVPTP